MTNSNGPNGGTPQPDRIGELEGFVEALDLSIENLEERTDKVEEKTDDIEDQVGKLTEKVTNLEQELREVYGDEDDWKRMSNT